MAQSTQDKVAQLYHQVDVSQATLADIGLAPYPRWSPTSPDYLMVALMKIESEGKDNQLDEVFQRSQHSSRRWFHGPGVLPTPVAWRSTMVGDVVILPSGVAYRCRSDGWERAYQPASRSSPSRLSAAVRR